MGPSPQARGNRGFRLLGGDGERSIPAGAGKPTLDDMRDALTGVHPRRRGETVVSWSMPLPTTGPSPQARGNQTRLFLALVPAGSIPAGAGKPEWSRCCSASWQVHPRRRGETGMVQVLLGIVAGSSPQARGNHREQVIDHASDGSIPAGAGKPSAGDRVPSRCQVHRRHGETVSAASSCVSVMGPSPQARGNPFRETIQPADEGSIPAGAGKPPPRSRPGSWCRVHPRRRGETA